MQNLVALHRPMLKLTENNFLGNFFHFHLAHFSAIPLGDIKKCDFFHFWITIKVVCLIQTYCMYTSFQNLENFLEHSEDRIGLSVMCFLYCQI